ncbi:MAG: carboxypeptidase M32 [Bacilli bacterium]|nr:carboxypeptidase M32 [Bacilli bacterium]
MELKQVIKTYVDYRTKMQALGYASYIISWDSETEAPVGCLEERSKQVGVLSEMSYSLERSNEYIETVKKLYENLDSLEDVLKVEIKKVYKDLMNSLKVPMEELVEYSILISKAQSIWADAKVNNDYKKFEPILDEIIKFNKRYVKYLETDELKGYDVLLDMYEEGMTKEKYDKFFSLLKSEIVPLVHKINKLEQSNNLFKNKLFDINKQKEFAEYIMDVMGFDKSRGLIKESEHPFTSGYGTSDVRITTHYYEDLLISSIFSCIHELGHATYEQQCNPILDETLVGGGASMAMHESQSRFYENIVGRSYEFWERHYPKLQSFFKEELKDVSLEDFYKHVNNVECSLIRTEADELTYPLHIMVRYEIEKLIIESDVDVCELPTIWNNLYKEYLGIDVPSDKEGILQDVHWAGGSFGYFPTYALGSAYGAQMLDAMKKDLDFEKEINKPNLKAINEWLKEHIHIYGATKNPDELINIATGMSFDATYYVEYLKNKFSKLYNL